MFATSRTTKLMLHVANLMVIAFILLPLVAVLIGSIQSEKALQADTRRVLPLEFTLDNFTVILTKGEQKGRIFEQVTYLPDNIKNFYTAFLNSAIVAGSVTFLTLLFGSLSAYTIARQRFRWTLFLLQANIVARFVPTDAGWMRSLPGRLLEEAGRHSLALFCLGVILSLLGTFAFFEIGRDGLMQVVVNVAGITILLLTAQVLQWYRRVTQKVQPQKSSPLDEARPA